MKKGKFFWRCEQGSIVMFLGIILSAVIVTESTLYYGAFMRRQESELRRCVELQMNQILSKYDRDFLENYGLYAFHNHDVNRTIYQTSFSAQDEFPLRVYPLHSTDKDILKSGLVQYMKLRIPALGVKEILQRTEILTKEMKDFAGLQVPNLENQKWLRTFSDFVQDKSTWVQSIADLALKVTDLDITGKTKDLVSFLTTTRQSIEYFSALKLQGQVDDKLDLDVLNPSKYKGFLDSMTQIVDFELPSMVESLLLNEYAVAALDSQLEFTYRKEQQLKETNFLGKPFTSIHQDNLCDLEFVFNGIEDEAQSKLLVNFALINFRLLCNLPAFLLDSQKVNQAKTMAAILSALIALVSLGSVAIDPQYLQYVVIFIWAIGESISDYKKLLAGKEIPFLKNEIFQKNDLLKQIIYTDYRDHLRLLLLLVPEKSKLQRLEKILQREFKENINIAITAEIQYRKQKYSWTKQYLSYNSFA